MLCSSPESVQCDPKILPKCKADSMSKGHLDIDVAARKKTGRGNVKESSS